MVAITDTGAVCPLCAGVQFRPFRLGLMRCSGCAAVFSPGIWQPSANEALQEEWFGDDYRLQPSFWIALFESWNNRRTLQRLASAARGKRLLEVGVGSGSFLNAARSHGYEVMGCDLSAAICDRVSAAYGIRMHRGALVTLADENAFDVIVMNHVLEHVNEPIQFLKDILRLLAPGGAVHIAVPNVSCWQAYFSGWGSYEPYHLSYFEPQTLARTVKVAGLTADKVITRDSFSGWFLTLLRTVVRLNSDNGAVVRPKLIGDKSLKKRRTGLIEHAYRLAMLCAGATSWPLRAVQSWLDRGDEVICIAHKPRPQSSAT